MGVTFAGVADWVGSIGAAAETGAAADTAATVGVAGGTAAAGGGTLAAQTAYAAGTASIGAGATEIAAGAGGAAAGSSLLGSVGTAAATALASQGVNALLAPKPPKAPGVTQVMPDPLAQQRARQQAMAEQLSRRGRASTVLSDNGGGQTLGG